MLIIHVYERKVINCIDLPTLIILNFKYIKHGVTGLDSISKQYIQAILCLCNISATN